MKAFLCAALVGAWLVGCGGDSDSSARPPTTRTPTPTVTPAASDYRGIVLGDGAGPYYRLNESGGLTVIDASATGRDAAYVVHGQLAYLQPSLLVGGDDPAVFVSHGGVQLPRTATSTTETVEGWFHP